ncbi:AMP-dependent synthetase and ligase [Gonapodya prolifera JEL478]|uniref:AMP-dependent synthetase and ligase n=1 Tax=Gonapodya prolifera (strain JEL478) TaxID=1344416 RepID=A0A139ASI1_GONPJ|nr:AMP-dependent synthetase and ligase [Gonapodya prolifera JEL478]|eukprot:KXS19700.1 AMP-dependent synthetase and ligase [Gonapodya prolifera JEL478]
MAAAPPPARGHPSIWAQKYPNRPAVIMASTGEVETYSALDKRSNQVAQLFRKIGIQTNDSIIVFMDNNKRYHDVVWGAQRSGVRFSCISSKLVADEVEYMVGDSQCKAFITCKALLPVARQVAKLCSGRPIKWYLVDGAEGPFEDLEKVIAKMPSTPIKDQSAGSSMLYTSGSTGRPKGVKRIAPPAPEGINPLDIDLCPPLVTLGAMFFGWPGVIGTEFKYLSPAPLYHAAPLGWTMAVHHAGGTVVIMESFDAEKVLALIHQYKIETGQFVPTHFIRLLRLPDAIKAKYSVASLTGVFHAAAPCPVAVKEQMINWWGPKIHEYYAGTEMNGFTLITSPEWLQHKGSVGRALIGELKICDEHGEPVPAGTDGTIFFANGPQFEYFNDPKKTSEARNKYGWSTLGDVGQVDKDGYLYLTDRKSFMIISGGVNIYPQEVENALVLHPAVVDAAVIGGPHEDMGEEVIAVVQPLKWEDASQKFADELKEYLRSRVSHVKVPRKIEFMKQLPRHDTGKLYKRIVKDAYWGKASAEFRGVVPKASKL